MRTPYAVENHRGSLSKSSRQRESALRLAMERMHELAQRLMTAQEEERKRIAAELHDDISQQLAAMSIGLSTLRRKLQSASPEVLGEIDHLHHEAGQLAETIRLLSHDLHPSMLQHVGLVGALRSRCRELERKSGLELVVEESGDLEHLSIATMACLFRTAQEALHNAIKHAHAKQVAIRLLRIEARVMMTVEDDGCGFDTAILKTHRGLGFITMDERARFAGGNMNVESVLGRGTKIRVEIPAGVG